MVSVLNNVRILVADDHEIVRRGIKALLSSRPGWIVCAEASTGREAVKLADEYKPNVVIMDIAMPDLNGLEATRQIRRMVSKPEVVILSLHYSDQLTREVVDAGARAYLLKTDASDELIRAVEAVANQRTYFTSGATRVLIDGFTQPPSTPATRLLRSALTAREREIVQLVAEGKSSKEVASASRQRIRIARTSCGSSKCTA